MIEILYTDFFSRSCSVSYCLLIQILLHWTNALLIECFEYNKRLHVVVAFWFGNSTMWRKTVKVWLYCKILLEHSRSEVMKPYLILESSSEEDFVGCPTVVLLAAACVYIYIYIYIVQFDGDSNSVKSS